MDPNATLAELRKLLGGDHSGLEFLQGAEANDNPTKWTSDPLSALCRAEELWDALDGWMSKGGFLPSSWAR